MLLNKPSQSSSNSDFASHLNQNLHRQKWRSPAANITVISISFGLLVWSLHFLQAHVGKVISVDAVVSGKLVDIHVPVEGQVISLNMETGSTVVQGDKLLTITNQRASDLPAQLLVSRVNEYRAELVKAEVQLARQKELEQIAKIDSENQNQLELSAVEHQIERLEADLIAAQSRQNTAQRNQIRARQLATAGAIPLVTSDDADASLQERQSEVQSLQAQLNTLIVNRDAAQAGLSLTKTRSNYDPRIRLQEIELKIADIQSHIVGLQQRIKDAQVEVQQARLDIARKKSVVLEAPATGVVWTLNAQQGKYMQQGESIGQIADCSQLWIDAVVDENAVKVLEVGIPAEVTLNGIDRSIEIPGSISMIRSGLGRTSVGADIALPMQPNAPRQSQVRVALDQRAQTVATQASGNMCYFGYTGRVTFLLKDQSKRATSLWSSSFLSPLLKMAQF